MNKYLIIGLSAFTIEICSTFYINYVSEKNAIGMLFFAGIGPFISLPFAGYMVESKTWEERLHMALALSIGYMVGSLIVIFLINNK
jgi:hypothetical protein